MGKGQVEVRSMRGWTAFHCHSWGALVWRNTVLHHTVFAGYNRLIAPHRVCWTSQAHCTTPCMFCCVLSFNPDEVCNGCCVLIWIQASLIWIQVSLIWIHVSHACAHLEGAEASWIAC